MPEKTRYIFARSEQSIFSEIYFPKRAAYYGTIFNALRKGYDEEVVKIYLRDNVQELLNDFRDYLALFDQNLNVVRRVESDTTPT